MKEAAAVSIIGGADGPTTIYTAAKLAPHLMATVAVAAYSYMALVPTGTQVASQQPIAEIN
jgi:oxaloacetate decarboxylase beta subunit